METLIVIIIKQDSQQERKTKEETIAERDYQEHNKNRNLN